MAPFTQAKRQLAVTTPLGADVLLLVAVSGREAISEPFSFLLELLAEKPEAVKFEELLGKPVTVAYTGPDDVKRYFNGICCRISQGERVQGAQAKQSFVRFTMEVVPKVWMLTRRANSRIFQHLNVPDILKKVFEGFDVSWQIQGTFEPRDYCVQYRETDFAFANRLMEEEGIWFAFEHTDGAHKMVVANTPQSHPSAGKATYVSTDAANAAALRVRSWEKTQEIRSGKVVLWDYCFEMPDKNLEAAQPTQDAVQVGKVAHKLKSADSDKNEIYDYPGAYAQRFDGIDKGGGEQASKLQKIFEDNKRTAGIRMQEEAALALEIAGTGNLFAFAAGAKFALSGHENADGEYVLTEVVHSARYESSYFATGSDADVPYSNSFTCIPAALPYRPARETPRPVVRGSQTAIVVGPSGEEIFTDKYGRVKVQFPWDREGKKDADSSCWVRVATMWAGKQWGMVHIPRIGQEVVVDFLEGDPDQPIIVGSVYNANQMPPYALPDNKTQSGLKSRSSLKGEAANFNELRLEDKKGSEEIYFHAEKDFNRVVENNDTLKVGSDKAAKGEQKIEIWSDRTITVKKGHETTTIEEGNREQTIKKGNDTLSIDLGNRTITVKTGNELHEIKTGTRTLKVEGDDLHEINKGNHTITVKKGNELHEIQKGTRTLKVEGDDVHEIKSGKRAVTISSGDDSLEVKLGKHTTKLGAGAYTIDATGGIELKVGGNSIKIDQSGITIKGVMIKIEADAMLNVKAGAILDLKGSAMAKLGGGITMIG